MSTDSPLHKVVPMEKCKYFVVLIGQRSLRYKNPNNAAPFVFHSREHVGQDCLHVDEEAADALANVWSGRHAGEGRSGGEKGNMARMVRVSICRISMLTRS